MSIGIDFGTVQRQLENSGGSGGGSCLPTPTADDVGKVATVVNNSGTYEYGLETPSSGGGGVLVVTDTDGTIDKTWTEIANAMTNYGAVLAWTNNGNLVAVNVFVQAESGLGGKFYVSTNTGDVYSANSADGYPALDE